MTMLLLSHILIAVTSIAFSCLSVFMPSRTKLQTSYGLVALTIASGTWLVISTRSALLSACVTGLIYLGASMAALILARRRLSA